MYKLLLTLILLSTSTSSYSGGLDWLVFDVSKFTGQQRDYVLNAGEETVGQQYTYQMKLSHRYHWLRKRRSELYWQSEIIGKSTTSQFRYIGWHTEIGMKIQDVEFFYDHFSEHLLDTGYARPYEPDRTHNHFPLMNRVGFRWFMYGRR